ncbi:unnamed protein product, partial [Adineta steineri]
EEIDGNLLMKLRFEEIKILFPKLKQRTIFMDEREKLLSKLCTEKDQSNSTSIDDNDSEEQLLLIDENMRSSDSVPFVEEIVIENTEVSLFDSNKNHSDNEENDNQIEENIIKLQDDYKLPTFPDDLQFVVDQNDLTKLAPHSYFRKVLLNLIYNDIANKHQLLYPKAQDYLIITKAVLRSLNIPVDNQNVLNEYRESIKQKFKNERKPLQKINTQVQRNKSKFGKGLGRPIKKSDLVSAERKTEKLMFIPRLDDEQDIFKLHQMMKDEFNKQPHDIDGLTYLWRKTFSSRRLFTRNHSIKEILSEYPAYSLSCLILEEIRITTDIDLEQNVESFLPFLFEKLPDNSMFISDILPIRVIKLLYQYFKDPISYVLTEKDPISPTPCIKMLDDKYELYLDYELIVQTTSAQEAISILLSLYNIFEVKFARHSRGVHLLYAIMFQDQNELTKSLRNLLVSWDYTIKNKLAVRQHLSTITATTLNNSNITQSTISMQSNENGLDVVEKVDSIQNQTINDMDQESVTNHSLNHAPALVVEENPIVISTTSKNGSMHSKKQSSQPVVDENIFETIECSSLNIEPVTKASQRPKKRKPTTSHEHITRSSSRIQSKKSRLS